MCPPVTCPMARASVAMLRPAVNAMWITAGGEFTSQVKVEPQTINTKTMVARNSAANSVQNFLVLSSFSWDIFPLERNIFEGLRVSCTWSLPWNCVDLNETMQTIVNFVNNCVNTSRTYSDKSVHFGRWLVRGQITRSLLSRADCFRILADSIRPSRPSRGITFTWAPLFCGLKLW